MRIPIGSAETGKGRNDVDAIATVDALGNGLGFCRILNQAQTIADPLDERSAHEDTAFDSILGTCAWSTCGNRGDEAVLRQWCFISGVHEQEATGPVRVLRLTRLEAALSKQRALLVTCNATNRNACHDAFARRLSEIARRRTHFGKHAHRNIEQLTQPRVPAHGVDVEQHGAAGIRGVSRVNFPIGQSPDEPCVNRAERELARLR